MRRFLRNEGPAALLAALVVAGCILVLGTALGWWRGVVGAPAGPPVTVAAVSLDPRTAQFGDSVDAQVDLLVNRAAVDPGRLRVEASFAPYAVSGPVVRTERDLGGASRVVVRFHLRCLETECLPRAGAAFGFPEGRVVAAGSGDTLARFPWPQLAVASRVAPGDLVPGNPPWSAPVEPLPAASYRISPGLAFGLLLGGGTLALLAAVALAALALGAEPFRALAGRRPRLSPLEEAVVLTRHAAEQGETEAQRRALERLATELRRHDQGELAKAAVRLAWSEDQPSSAEMMALAGRAEEAER